MTLTRHVYLAGPITDCSYKNTMEWRARVQKMLFLNSNGKIIGISPMRLKQFLEGQKKIGHHYPKEEIYGKAQAIATRDFYDVTHCDMVLAFMPKNMPVSAGTILEVGWATAHNVPVVLVSDREGIINHPLILGHVGWILDNLEDGVAAVTSVLLAYIK